MMTVNRILSDTVMVVVHCPDTDSYVLSHPPTGWSIPYSICMEGSWRKEAVSLYRKIFGACPSDTLELKKTLRVWQVDNNFLHTLVFHAEVDGNLLKGVKSDGPERFEVINSTEIQELTRRKNLSPEVLTLLDISAQGPCPKSLKTNFIEVTKDEVISPKNNSSKLNTFINTETTESDQMSLYTCYLDVTYPFLTMDEIAMTSFMRRLGIIPFTSDHFRSADIHNKGCVDFREFLGFLVALKGTTKRKLGAEHYSSYVFRYYDKDRDDKLTKDEFEGILNDIEALKPNLNDKKVLLESVKEDNVTQEDFSKMVMTLKLRGVSRLLVNPSIPLAMRNARSRSTSLRISRDSITSQKLQMPRPAYSLGGHIVTIYPDGHVTSTPIQTIEQGIKVDSTVTDQTMLVPSPSSTEIFEGSPSANNVIAALQFFADNVSSAAEDQNKWFEVGFNDFPKDLTDCCNQVKVIFERESRMLRIDSPVYVIGDVHGRFNDIANFQRYFWNYGIECCPGSILFLGDYVDRGKNSVEVIAYLIAQKVKNHKKLYLLRGNHETRKVQKEHTFFNECTSKFESGAEIWEAINEAFDRMPLAALVDDQIFCCHGGIPMPSQCKALDDINKIPCPLKQLSESKLAWALLWNDPQKIGYNTIQANKSSDGFTQNSRRRTGHTFDKNALNSFLEKHKLSYVIRAHEVQDAGFQVDLDNRLITVFSSSNYKGNNHSGCVLVHKNKLRILTIPPTLEKDVPTQ